MTAIINTSMTDYRIRCFLNFCFGFVLPDCGPSFAKPEPTQLSRFRLRCDFVRESMGRETGKQGQNPLARAKLTIEHYNDIHFDQSFLLQVAGGTILEYR